MSNPKQATTIIKSKVFPMHTNYDTSTTLTTNGVTGATYIEPSNELFKNITKEVQESKNACLLADTELAAHLHNAITEAQFQTRAICFKADESLEDSLQQEIESTLKQHSVDFVLFVGDQLLKQETRLRIEFAEALEQRLKEERLWNRIVNSFKANCAWWFGV